MHGLGLHDQTPSTSTASRRAFNTTHTSTPTAALHISQNATRQCTACALHLATAIVVCHRLDCRRSSPAATSGCSRCRPALLAWTAAVRRRRRSLGRPRPLQRTTCEMLQIHCACVLHVSHRPGTAYVYHSTLIWYEFLLFVCQGHHLRDAAWSVTACRALFTNDPLRSWYVDAFACTPKTIVGESTHLLAQTKSVIPCSSHVSRLTTRSGAVRSEDMAPNTQRQCCALAL